MASREEKLRAMDFICHKLEDSRLYEINNKDHQRLFFKEKNQEKARGTHP